MWADAHADRQEDLMNRIYGADMQPYIPRGKYIRRIARIIAFGYLTFGLMSIAISSYVHGHRTGYTPVAQLSTAANAHPNPLPFLVAGVFCGLLALLQTRKTIRVYKLRQGAFSEYPCGEFAPPTPQYGATPQRPVQSAGAPVIYPQTGSTMRPTAAQNAVYNAHGAAVQNAARNVHGNAQ
jgi:hypothetical protein